MQKYTDVILSYAGSNNLTPLASATITVTLAAGGAATLYSDNGVTPLANPFTSDSTGRVSFYAADGRYTLVAGKLGYLPVTISDILLEDPANPSPVRISGGTVDNTPIGLVSPSSGSFTTMAVQTWTAAQRPFYLNTDTVSATGTYTYDGTAKGQVNLVTLTNAITVTFGAPTNIVEGCMYKLILKAGDTSARTFAWATAYKFPAATAPLTSGAVVSGAYDVVTFIGGAGNTLIYDGSNASVR